MKREFRSRKNREPEPREKRQFAPIASLRLIACLKLCAFALPFTLFPPYMLHATFAGLVYFESAKESDHRKFTESCGAMPAYSEKDELIDYVNVLLYRSPNECRFFEDQSYCITHVLIASNNACAGAFYSVGVGQQVDSNEFDDLPFADPFSGLSGEELPLIFNADPWRSRHGLLVFSAPGKALLVLEDDLMGKSHD